MLDKKAPDAYLEVGMFPALMAFLPPLDPIPPSFLQYNNSDDVPEELETEPPRIKVRRAPQADSMMSWLQPRFIDACLLHRV